MNKSFVSFCEAPCFAARRHSRWTFRFLAVLAMLFSFNLANKAQAQVGVADSVLLAGLVHIEYGAVLPAGDLGNRFGFHNAVGLHILVKGRNNWMFGPSGQFYFGNQLRGDSTILDGLREENGFIIGNDGLLYSPILSMRGWSASFQAGKLTGLGHNPNSGLVLLGGIGFMQHKIKIDVGDGVVPQLFDDNKKGYDRLSNGIFLEQYIGYLYSGSDRFVNFRAGIEFKEGFTAERRAIFADTGEVPEGSRLDIQISAKVAWVLPIYEKSKSQYYYY